MLNGHAPARPDEQPRHEQKPRYDEQAPHALLLWGPSVRRRPATIRLMHDHDAQDHRDVCWRSGRILRGHVPDSARGGRPGEQQRAEAGAVRNSRNDHGGIWQARPLTPAAAAKSVGRASLRATSTPPRLPATRLNFAPRSSAEPPLPRRSVSQVYRRLLAPRFQINATMVTSSESQGPADELLTESGGSTRRARRAPSRHAPHEIAPFRRRRLRSDRARSLRARPPSAKRHPASRRPRAPGS